VRETIGHGAQREGLRMDVAALDLFPRARRGHRRAAPGANGVRRGKRGAVAVAPGVDVDSSAPFRLGELLCEPIARSMDERGTDLVGELGNKAHGRVGRDRDHDVVALRA
jgi:hypothetical protein